LSDPYPEYRPEFSLSYENIPRQRRIHKKQTGKEEDEREEE
jgi:hypothetical protein